MINQSESVWSKISWDKNTRGIPTELILRICYRTPVLDNTAISIMLPLIINVLDIHLEINTCHHWKQNPTIQLCDSQFDPPSTALSPDEEGMLGSDRIMKIWEENGKLHNPGSKD